MPTFVSVLLIPASVANMICMPISMHAFVSMLWVFCKRYTHASAACDLHCMSACTNGLNKRLVKEGVYTLI